MDVVVARIGRFRGGFAEQRTRVSSWRPTAATRLVVLAGLVLVTFLAGQTFSVNPAAEGGDAWNYLAAGERLNDGHPLYALSAGDRPVPLRPPYWSVPLLSPPLIAVIWRPLALIGEPAMYLWWIGGVVACAALAAWILLRGNAWQLVGLVVLAPVLALTAISGNAAAYLVPLLAFRHPATVALAAGVKLSPAMLAPATGILRVLKWVVVLGVISLIGAGVENHLDWLNSVPQSAPSPASISGITGIPAVIVFTACAAMSLFGWSAGVVATTFATPVVYFSTLVFLVLVVTPRPPTGVLERSGRMRAQPIESGEVAATPQLER